jgi:predicted O-methyltransferase YrrM
MKYNEVNSLVKGIPFTTERNAEKLYNFIIDNKIQNVLELGFAHGTASCYIAAALDEQKSGHLVAVDLIAAEELFKPTINDLLKKTGLASYVTIARENTGYNWFMHGEIEKNSKDYVCTPKYDLVIIDGPKNWTIDGAAFFLADKLLNENGWVIFDDYNWTYAGEAKQGYNESDGIQHTSLSADEFNKPQIKEIFQLLVMQHPNYTNFKIHGEGDWAWAQKVSNTTVKKLDIEYNVTYKDFFSRIFKVINNIFKFRKV